MANESENLNTAGAFEGQGENGNQVDRSASGLQFQAFNLGLKATGAALGRGRRTTPDPSVQFSRPPMSNAQFGEGENAREEM